MSGPLKPGQNKEIVLTGEKKLVFGSAETKDIVF